MPKIEKYLKVFSLSFSYSLRNYKALVGLSIFLVTCLIIFAHLWKVAAAKTDALFLNPKHLLWYIAFNEWVLISLPDIQDKIEQDLRSGRLAYLLPRPLSYLGAIFAEATGTLMANLLVLGWVTFLFSWWEVGELPFHFIGLIVTIFLGLLAGLIGVLFQMLIGVSAFWLQDVSPFYWIWEKLLFLFGGLILPLTVYPQWMQTLAYFTPFPLILGGRSALALDYNLTHVLMLTVGFISWTALALLGLLFFISQRTAYFEFRRGIGT